MIVEPVQLSRRVHPLPADWLRALRRRCADTGSVLIFDEVKCGLNRCGPLWAHESAGVTPDVLVTGKALTAGLYPVAACGLRSDDGPLRGGRPRCAPRTAAVCSPWRWRGPCWRCSPTRCSGSGTGTPPRRWRSGCTTTFDPATIRRPGSAVPARRSR
ncbi:aminotransferase class III-fold pyridoxal phosphate-dependent enzyme [Micromonospora sp. Llam7]|nr:aminotransferase class III-fold pyridoxal phosphate-dependent enzyme [Micromonospora tarapacensis]